MARYARAGSCTGWNVPTDIPESNCHLFAVSGAAASTLSPIVESEMRCSGCGWHGDERALVMANDSQDGELTNAACPMCLTDHFLTELPEGGCATEGPADEQRGEAFTEYCTGVQAT